MSETNVIPLAPPRERPGSTRRLDFFAHVRVLKAEADRRQRVLRFRERTRGLIERINRIDFFIRAKVVEYSQAHGRHAGLNYEGHHATMPKWLYVLTIAIAGALEVPLNSHALQALRMDDIETMGVALGVGLLNLLAGSMLGAKLRHSVPMSRWKDLFVLVALALAVGASIHGLTDLRSAFMAFRYGGGGAVDTSPAAFVSLQVLFFGVAVALSYFARPENVALHTALQDKRAAGEALKRLWRQREVVARKYNFELVAARDELRAIEVRAQQEIAEYRYENARRRQSAVPAYFHEPVGAEVFTPIDLGEPVDPDPKRIDVLFEEALS